MVQDVARGEQALLFLLHKDFYGHQPAVQWDELRPTRLIYSNNISPSTSD
jgi:hypothetical protein